MQMLHAATGPKCARDPELLFATCRTFTPAPFETFGKSAPLGNMPWAPTGALYLGDNTPGTCVHPIAYRGASLNSASEAWYLVGDENFDLH